MSDQRLDAARDRVAAIFDQLSRVELQVVVVTPPDDERRAARERARDAAIVAGRGPLLDEAVRAARDATIRVFALGGFSGTWAATDMAVSVVRASDRVAAEAALEEAVIAAVVQDLVDEDTLDVLRSTWDELARLRGIPSPGSLAAFTAPAAGAIREYDGQWVIARLWRRVDGQGPEAGSFRRRRLCPSPRAVASANT